MQSGTAVATSATHQHQPAGWPHHLSAGRTNLAEPPFFGGFFLFYMKCAMGRHETSLETVEIPPGR